MRGRVVTLSLALILTVGVTAIAVFIEHVPSTADYSPYNTYWNGLSELSKYVKPLRDYRALNALDPRRHALIVIPLQPVGPEEAEYLRSFVSGGGILIVMDDSGASNELFKLLDLEVRVNNFTVADPIYRLKSPYLPVVKVRVGSWEGDVVLDIAGTLEAAGRDWVVIARTSRFSYMDVSGDGTHDIFEPSGPFPVAAFEKYGEGCVYVVSDPDIFINSLIGLEGNAGFLKAVANGREVLLDVKHLDLPLVDRVRDLVKPSEAVGVRALQIAVLIALPIAFLAVRPRGGGVVSKSLYLANAYIASLATYYIATSGDFVALLLLAGPATVLLRRYRVSWALLLPAAAYLGRVAPLTYLALPVAIAYPLVGLRGIYPSKSDVLGANSSDSLRVALLSLIASALDVRSAPIVLVSITSTIALALAWYIKLGAVAVNAPKGIIKGVLREKLVVPIEVRSSTKVKVLIATEGGEVFKVVKGLGVLQISLNTLRLGYRVADSRVFIEDYLGLSSRVKELRTRYNVVPSFKAIAEVVEEALGGLVEFIGGYLGGLGRGAGGRGAGRAPKPPTPPIVVLPAIKRRRRGEYLGTRYYVPGDDPRSIHWKKSLSKGDLVVKEYGSGGGGGFGGIIVIADLTSANEFEFDKLSYTLLALLIRNAVRFPANDTIVIIITPDGGMGAIRGGSVEVLAAITYMFNRKMFSVEYDYRSMGRLLTDEEVRAISSSSSSIAVTIKAASELFTKKVLDLLYRARATLPRPYTAIHGRATAFRYSYLRSRFKDLGCTYVTPSLTAIEDLRRLASQLPEVV